MRHQHVQWLVAVVASIAAGLCFCAGIPGLFERSIPCSHLDRVLPGMSADEVRATLGGPNGVERYAEAEAWRYHCDHGGGIVTVRFDRDGKVDQTSLAD